jgi:hypothetical protein
VSIQKTRPGRRPLRKRMRRRAVRLYRRLSSDAVVERGPGWVSWRGERSVVLRRDADEPRRGIYLRGACDLPSMFLLAPVVIEHLEGSLCIHLGGSGAADARSDLLLQSYSGVPPWFEQEVGARFTIPPGYFADTLFQPTFEVADIPGKPAFPRTVVVLSILPDLTRAVYRHRRTGYLIDPGTAWLNRIATARRDPSLVNWFQESWEPVGRTSVEQLGENYRRLIPLVKEKTGAEIMVFNALEIEPNDPTHDYSLRHLESASRRRRFNLALAELSEELSFRVVDVDRILKVGGVDRQIDFSHFPVGSMRDVAAEAGRILADIGVV